MSIDILSRIVISYDKSGNVFKKKMFFTMRCNIMPWFPGLMLPLIQLFLFFKTIDTITYINYAVQHSKHLCLSATTNTLMGTC